MDSTYLLRSTSSFPNLSIRTANKHSHEIVSFTFHPQMKQLQSSRRRRLTIIRSAAGDGGDSHIFGRERSSTGGGSGASSYSLFKLPQWSKWLVAVLIWVSLPMSKKLKDVGDSLKKVDAVVEVIRDVAEKADDIAEDLGEQLPEGAFKDVVEKIEKISEVVGSKAKALDDSIDTVTEMIDGKREEEKEAKEKEEKENQEGKDDGKLEGAIGTKDQPLPPT